MSCEEIRDALQDRLDARVEGPAPAEILAHLGRCAACAAFERDLRSLVSLVRATPEDAAPEGFASGVLARIAAEERAAAAIGGPRRFAPPAALRVAAAFAAVAAGGFFAWKALHAPRTDAVPDMRVARAADEESRPRRLDHDLDERPVPLSPDASTLEFAERDKAEANAPAERVPPPAAAAGERGATKEGEDDYRFRAKRAAAPAGAPAGAAPTPAPVLEGIAPDLKRDDPDAALQAKLARIGSETKDGRASDLGGKDAGETRALVDRLKGVSTSGAETEGTKAAVGREFPPPAANAAPEGSGWDACLAYTVQLDDAGARAGVEGLVRRFNESTGAPAAGVGGVAAPTPGLAGGAGPATGGGGLDRGLFALGTPVASAPASGDGAVLHVVVSESELAKFDGALTLIRGCTVQEGPVFQRLEPPADAPAKSEPAGRADVYDRLESAADEIHSRRSQEAQEREALRVRLERKPGDSVPATKAPAPAEDAETEFARRRLLSKGIDTGSRRSPLDVLIRLYLLPAPPAPASRPGAPARRG